MNKEIEMGKHTDRQIYLDEDERFAVGISNMEIVRYLFLYQTRNSGGCSTRDFCEKLGVDPYKSVKFEFERDEEE